MSATPDGFSVAPWMPGRLGEREGLEGEGGKRERWRATVFILWVICDGKKLPWAGCSLLFFTVSIVLDFMARWVVFF